MYHSLNVFTCIKRSFSFQYLYVNSTNNEGRSLSYILLLGLIEEFSISLPQLFLKIQFNLLSHKYQTTGINAPSES